MKTENPVSLNVVILTGILFSVWLCRLFLAMWYINCGLDFTDESYYHLYMLYPEQMGWIVYVKPLHFFFPFLQGNIIFSRVFKIIVEHLAAIILTCGFFSAAI